MVVVVVVATVNTPGMVYVFNLWVQIICLVCFKTS